MNKYIIVISSLFVALATGAVAVTDDFNRADTVPSVDTSLIGVNWAQAGGSGNEWFINSDVVTVTNDSTPAIMYNTTLETLGGAASGGQTHCFSVSLDVAMETNGVWAGAVFNYQDDANYYCFRIKAGSDEYQVLSVVGESVSVLTNGNAAAIFSYGSGDFYRLTISSDSLGSFAVKARKVSTGALFVQADAVDSEQNFTDGYAGLYVSALIPEEVHAFASWDNFNLQTSVYGDIMVDRFNRANTAQTAYTVNVGGSGWAQAGDGGSTTGDDWFVNNSVARLRDRQANAVMYNTDLSTVSGNGTNFVLSADVSGRLANAYAGVVFNYSDESTYYVLRIKAGATDYQILEKTGGGQNVLINEDLTVGTFAVGSYYTMTVTSDTAGDFGFTITEAGSSTVLNSVTNYDDSASALTEGYAGLYGTYTGNHSGQFDDFRLAVTGPALTGYAAWVIGWGGIDIGAETNDYDADGLSNIYEYGLGGDPTNGLDRGTSPEYAVVDSGGSNIFQYVHPQLSDADSGLNYYLEVSTNLVSGTWTNSGYAVVGTNVAGTLDFVTNTVDMADSQKFVRLIIE